MALEGHVGRDLSNARLLPKHSPDSHGADTLSGPNSPEDMRLITDPPHGLRARKPVTPAGISGTRLRVIRYLKCLGEREPGCDDAEVAWARQRGNPRGTPTLSTQRMTYARDR